MKIWRKITSVLLGACFATSLYSGCASAEAIVVTTAEQLSTAVAAGDDVTLGADISLSSTLYVTKTVNLDLNGHTLNTASSTIFPYNSSTLTISDSGDGGMIYGTATYPIQVGGSGYTATVILESGKIVGNSKAVRVLGGEFIMNGGEISAPGSYIIALGNTSGNTGKFTMNGGKITTSAQGFNVNAGSELVMNGGEISAYTNAIYSKGTVTINDGTIKTTRTTDNFYTVQFLSGEFTMNGGKIESQRYFPVHIGDGTNTAKATMKGGTVSSSYYGVMIEPGSEFVMDGGKIEGKAFLVYNTSGTFTMNDGEIISSDGDDYPAVRNTGAEFEMNGGEIVVTSDGIGVNFSPNGDDDGSTGVINGGKITAVNGGTAIVGFKNADITINGGEFDADGNTICGNGSGSEGYDGTVAKFTITGGTFHSAVGNALYLPQQNGESKISGGTFASDTYSAVEIRAGKVRITGGEFTSNGNTYEVTDYTNGSSTKGAAVAVAQHTTKRPIDLYICGGKFQAKVPFSEANPLGNDDEAINKITLVIDQPCADLEFVSTGDTAVYSEDFAGFISGGIYTHKVNDYVADGFESLDYVNGRYIVARPHLVTVAATENGTAAVSRERASKDMSIEVTVTPADGYKLSSLTARTEGGDEIQISNGKFTMPDDDVTIIAAFEKIPEPEPQPEPEPTPAPEPVTPVEPEELPENPDTNDDILAHWIMLGGCYVVLLAAMIVGRR